MFTETLTVLVWWNCRFVAFECLHVMGNRLLAIVTLQEVYDANVHRSFTTVFQCAMYWLALNVFIGLFVWCAIPDCDEQAIVHQILLLKPLCVTTNSFYDLAPLFGWHA